MSHWNANARPWAVLLACVLVAACSGRDAKDESARVAAAQTEPLAACERLLSAEASCFAQVAPAAASARARHTREAVARATTPEERRALDAQCAAAHAQLTASCR